MSLRSNLKTLSVFIGLAALVLTIRYTSTLPASSEEVSLVKDENYFSKASLEIGAETDLTPEIDVQVEAAGAFVEGGKEVFGWEMDKRWPIASLTKLMTAVVAFEKIEPAEIIIITKEAVASEGVAGSFSEGEKFRLNDLVKSMMLVSSNDAAEAIALHFGKEEFIKAMNSKALELGMNQTNFVDVTGISTRNQSTINDLIRLTEYIRLFEPGILGTSRKVKDTIIEVRTGKRRTLVNINYFAGDRDFVGGKTGSTPEAGGNLISIFNIADGPKTVIVLGTEDRFGETTKIKESLWQ